MGTASLASYVRAACADCAHVIVQSMALGQDTQNASQTPAARVMLLQLCFPMLLTTCRSYFLCQSAHLSDSVMQHAVACVSFDWLMLFDAMHPPPPTPYQCVHMLSLVTHVFAHLSMHDVIAVTCGCTSVVSLQM